MGAAAVPGKWRVWKENFCNTSLEKICWRPSVLSNGASCRAKQQRGQPPLGIDDVEGLFYQRRKRGSGRKQVSKKGQHFWAAWPTSHWSLHFIIRVLIICIAVASSGPNWKAAALYEALSKHGIGDTPFPMGFASGGDTHRVAEDRKLSFTGSHCKCNDVFGANKADSHYPHSYLIQNPLESVEASQHKPRYLSHSPSTQLSPQHPNRQGFWLPATPSWTEMQPWDRGEAGRYALLLLVGLLSPILGSSALTKSCWRLIQEGEVGSAAAWRPRTRTMRLPGSCSLQLCKLEITAAATEGEHQIGPRLMRLLGLRSLVL